MKYLVKNKTTGKVEGFTRAIDTAITLSKNIKNTGVFRKNKIDKELEQVY